MVFLVVACVLEMFSNMTIENLGRHSRHSFLTKASIFVNFGGQYFWYELMFSDGVL